MDVAARDLHQPEQDPRRQPAPAGERCSTAPIRIAVQTAMKACQGRIRIGVEDLQERRRVDVRDRVGPVRPGVRIGQGREPVAVGVLAGAPQPAPRFREGHDRPPTRRPRSSGPARGALGHGGGAARAEGYGMTGQPTVRTRTMSPCRTCPSLPSRARGVRRRGDDRVTSRPRSSRTRTSSRRQGIRWIHIESPRAVDRDWLEDHFDFHPLDFEDVYSRNNRPKLDQYDDYVFIVLHFPLFDKDIGPVPHRRGRPVHRARTT